MPILQSSAATTYASGVSLEPCNGWTYEYLPWPAAVKVLCQFFGGATAGTVSVYSGSESIIESQTIQIGPATLSLPNDLACHPITFHAPAGDRLRVKLTSTAANTQFQYVIVVEPIR
ncbi:MAG: hypothetical protein LLG45_13455 [Actinomycetia bacterium]|nr:hypothetical protein [Actinomycetes bacterium]